MENNIEHDQLKEDIPKNEIREMKPENSKDNDMLVEESKSSIESESKDAQKEVASEAQKDHKDQKRSEEITTEKKEKEGKKDIEKKEEMKKDKKKVKSEVQKLKEKMERLKSKYEKKLEMKEKELQEQKEKYLYLAAELDNARKHFKKQADREVEKSVGKVIEMFLPLIESFEKALELKEQIPKEEITPRIQAFLEGFENIYRKFQDSLKSLDVKPIDETGIKFDYRYHEVMMKIENPEIEDNTVVQVLQKGYLIGNKVLRPAKVIVSRRPKKQEPAKEEEKVERSEKKEEREKVERSEKKEETEAEKKTEKNGDEIKEKDKGQGKD